jgi:hypothetical protein
MHGLQIRAIGLQIRAIGVDLIPQKWKTVQKVFVVHGLQIRAIGFF